MNVAPRFQKGDELIVRPSDADDPDAIAHAGETCTFVRRLDSPGPLLAYARVRFGDDPKEYVMRMRDLVRKEGL